MKDIIAIFEKSELSNPMSVINAFLLFKNNKFQLLSFEIVIRAIKAIKTIKFIEIKQQKIWEQCVKWSKYQCKAFENIQHSISSNDSIKSNDWRTYIRPFIKYIRFALIQKPYFENNIIPTNVLSENEILSVAKLKFNIVSTNKGKWIVSNHGCTLSVSVGLCAVSFATSVGFNCGKHAIEFMIIEKNGSIDLGITSDNSQCSNRGYYEMRYAYDLFCGKRGVRIFQNKRLIRCSVLTVVKNDVIRIELDCDLWKVAFYVNNVNVMFGQQNIKIQQNCTYYVCAGLTGDCKLKLIGKQTYL